MRCNVVTELQKWVHGVFEWCKHWGKWKSRISTSLELQIARLGLIRSVDRKEMGFLLKRVVSGSWGFSRKSEMDCIFCNHRLFRYTGPSYCKQKHLVLKINLFLTQTPVFSPIRQKLMEILLFLLSIDASNSAIFSQKKDRFKNLACSLHKESHQK